MIQVHFGRLNSKGGLLYHFASKELLIAAMVERMTLNFETARAEAMAQDKSMPGAWTRSFVRATCGESEGDVELASCLIAAIALNPNLLAPLRRQYETWMQMLDADGLPPADAHIVRLAMDGLWLCTLLGLAIPSVELQHQIRQRLLDLACADASAAPSGCKTTERT